MYTAHRLAGPVPETLLFAVDCVCRPEPALRPRNRRVGACLWSGLGKRWPRRHSVRCTVPLVRCCSDEHRHATFFKSFRLRTPLITEPSLPCETGSAANRAVLLTALLSTVYGPLLDAFHTTYGTLQYYKVNWNVHVGFQTAVGFTWWTPILFGVAGSMLARLGLQSRQTPFRPELVVRTAAGVALFTFQYWLSAYLDGSGHLGTAMIALVLSSLLPVQCWVLGSSTAAEFGVMISTAMLGPFVELWLIDGLHLYHYAHPEVWCHIPLWIGAIYACGSLAVQQLARCIFAIDWHLRNRKDA